MVSRSNTVASSRSVPASVLALFFSLVPVGYLPFSPPYGLSAQDRSFVFEVPPGGAGQWLKGNTHAHTTESDGDSSPEFVARWYKDHGYDFLVLSDHNVLADIEALRGLMDSTFLLIPGEEVTSGFGEKPVHVNGLNLSALVAPSTGSTLVGTIQANVDAVRAEDGVPHINHPNFGWAFGAEELAQIENHRLLEIFNGHPSVHNQGGGDHPGMEEVWDLLLSRGQRVYGIAVDDAHHFQGEFSRERSNPGRGWVAVNSPTRDPATIMRALEAGRFYASTGVDLDDFLVEEGRLEVRIRPRGDFKFTTTFIGTGGKILKTTGDNPAVFELSGPELYVRARVMDSGGSMAWIQPVFVRKR
ncbi:CehA/McbA family metallohydrolase [Gemmatimonadota bacterium]